MSDEIEKLEAFLERIQRKYNFLHPPEVEKMDESIEISAETIATQYTPRKREVFVEVNSPFWSHAYTMKWLFERILGMKCKEPSIEYYGGAENTIGFECVVPEFVDLKRLGFLTVFGANLFDDLMLHESLEEPEDTNIAMRVIEKVMKKASEEDRETYETALEALREGDIDEYFDIMGYNEEPYEVARPVGKEIAKRHFLPILHKARNLLKKEGLV